MFEQLGLDGWTPVSASVVLGSILGLAFGALAQRSRFCLRRALTGAAHERSAALGTWLAALAVAIAGTTAITAYGIVSFAEHRFHALALPVGAIVLGGILFGVGMYLARGCASRLTVLAGSGNLRALIVLLVFAISAHATLKGTLAPARVWLSSFQIDASIASLGSLPGGAVLWSSIVLIGPLVIISRSSATVGGLALGGLIGALVPIGWLGTGFLLYDEFEPITLESLAFTSAASEALFWSIAASAIAPAFGVGLFGGVLIGSALAAVLSGEFRIVGFTSTTKTPTGRYLLGGLLMGVGGVLAGGCTVGAGLGGIATLSISAILALLSIGAGALAAQALSDSRRMTAAVVAPAE